MTDLKRTEQPDLTWDEAMGLAVARPARPRPDKTLIQLAPSLWPTKRQPRRVGFLRWAWVVVHETTGVPLASGITLTETLAWTRTDRAAKRIRDERAAKRAES